MKTFTRTFRRLRRHGGSPTMPAAPRLSLEELRRQLPELPPAERAYLQDLLASKGGELKQQLDQTGTNTDELSGQKSVENYITAELEINDDPSSLGKSFWQAVGRLAKSKSTERTSLFVTLFEVAKAIPDPVLRSQCICLTGTYLYRLKTVRFDPINEVEYLDSLVREGKQFLALKYWNSRNNREDVRHSAYWKEAGTLYYLEAGLNISAERVAAELEKSGIIPSRVIVQFIRAYSRRPSTKLQLERWTLLLCAQIKQSGIEYQSTEQVQDVEHFMTQRNKKTTLTEVRTALDCLMKTQNWTLAARLIGCLKLNEAKQLDIPSLVGFIPSKERKPDGDVSNFIDAALELTPTLLQSPQLYLTWISSLALENEHHDIEDILELMDANNIRFVAHDVTRLLSFLLKLSKVDVALCLHKYYNSSETSTQLIKYYSHHDRKELVKVIDGLSSPLTPALASSIVRSGYLGKFDLLELGLDQTCWLFVWAFLRDNLNFDCREAFGATISSLNTPLSLNTMETVVQAFMMHRDFVGACAALRYLQNANGAGINKLLFASIKSLADNLAKKRPISFGKPVPSNIVWDPAIPGNENVSCESVTRLLEKTFDLDLSSEAASVATRWSQLKKPEMTDTGLGNVD